MAEGETRELLRRLHEKIGVSDDPEADDIVRTLRARYGDPAGSMPNDLVHRLYDKLGGLPNQARPACPACVYAGAPEERPFLAHSHAHVACADGETSGIWRLDCTRQTGATFTVTGASYAEALNEAIRAADAPA